MGSAEHGNNISGLITDGKDDHYNIVQAVETMVINNHFTFGIRFDLVFIPHPIFNSLKKTKTRPKNQTPEPF